MSKNKTWNNFADNIALPIMGGLAGDGVGNLAVRGVGNILGRTSSKVGRNLLDEVFHGNSLKSTRPTWGYKLYSNDGTFLKNGITSQKIS